MTHMIVKHIFLFSIILLLSSCSTVGYYGQSVKGHLSLIAKQKPINKILEDKKTSKQRRNELELIQEIRAYAYDKLKLPKNGSYAKFVELDRKAVTWNLVATPKYSMSPSQWCFPIIGCISYKGYFSEAKARSEAKKTEQLGYDVYVAESTAYSTLGWFNDPVVSTMLDHGILLTAETIFHELSHQRVYHKSDSDFNEAFASAVGQAGTRLWLKEKHPKSLNFYDEHLRKQQQFIGLLLNVSSELSHLYKVKMTDAETEKGKQKILKGLRFKYTKLKQSWGGDSGYDSWFDKPINNARLALAGVYSQQIPYFSRQLKHHNYDFEKFYTAMDELGKLSKEKRQKQLKQSAKITFTPSEKN